MADSLFDIDQYKPGDIIVNLDYDTVYEDYYGEFPPIKGHLVAEIVTVHGEWADMEVIGFLDSINSQDLHKLELDFHPEIHLTHVKLFVPPVNNPALYERPLL
jgi:hypothetical protein